MERGGGSLAGFLVIAFALVGLVGLFATYAAPLPLQRALARDGALDAVLQAAEGPNAAATLAALRPALGESAAAVLDGDKGSLASRVESARANMRKSFLAEEAAVLRRLRILIGIVTATCALFGVVILRIAGKKANYKPAQFGSISSA
ncbi:MAG: hypothetical protein K6U10_00785 [Acidobacteriia bacterium]|nr:hypothetical protein [Methyloceanibacter sp.]MCL6490338.1 hypothetical protein [Terriglobia bacterium]